MKFTINRSSFLKQLNTVNVAIGPKSPTPAFLNFKLEMLEDGLKVLGSDNEITIENFLPISTEEKTYIEDYTVGSTLISAKYLLEIIRRLDGDKVTVEVIDDVIVQISDNKAHFQLNSMRSEEYPDLDLAVLGHKVVFTTAEFKKIVSQTTFAASTRDVRPILTAVNFKAGNEVAEFVATDSYRLSKKTMEISNSDNFEVNVPVKALNEVSKLLEEDVITLYIAANKIVFEFGGTKFFSRLINGDFPKTSRMIPSTYPFVLKVNANAFVNAMQRVSLLAVERERIVKLTLDESGVEISSKSEQIGSANEKIELFEYEGGRLDISFNVDYVTDAIKAAQSEDVILSFAGEMNAFRVTSPEDESIIQIVTPVRSYY